MFEVPLGAETVAVLAELAAKTGVTPEEFARRAILKEMEDTEDYLLAAERLQTSLGESVSLDSVKARQQSEAVASSASEKSDQAFVDAVSDFPEV